MSSPEYNRRYYLQHREQIIENAKQYYREYTRTGLRKTDRELANLTPEQKKERRRQMQHDRYMRNRDEILANQREYAKTHKDEIRQRRHRRIQKMKRKQYRRNYDREREYKHTTTGIA